MTNQQPAPGHPDYWPWNRNERGMRDPEGAYVAHLEGEAVYTCFLCWFLVCASVPALFLVAVILGLCVGDALVADVHKAPTARQESRGR
jgi:hypothetical protein